MRSSVGNKGTVGDAAVASEDFDDVRTLAYVLQKEFDELHGKATDQTQDRTAAGLAEPQQPLEDPSLSPADQDAHDQRVEHPEVSALQEHSAPDALRHLWESVHRL